jgi:outer membrane protein assembly factor BamB
MNARRWRALVAVVIAGAVLFVARPAHGARSGSEAVVWSAPVTDGPSDLAADSRGMVVVTSAASVLAFDRGGHEQWHVHVEGLVRAQPAVGGEVVLVSAGGAVVALSRADGSRRWTRPMGRDAHALAVSGATALAGDDGGALSALDLATGAVRWSVRFPGSLWSGPRIDRATGAVVATWHQTVAPAVRVFDLTSGAPRWEAPTAAYTAAPAVHGGRVILAIGDGDRHARVEARALATGALEWRTPVPASFEEAIEPAIDDHDVAVVDHFGVVSVLDPATGRLRWRHDLAHALLETRMTLTATRVAFTSFSGDVFVLDRSDGRVVARLGRRQLGGYPTATLPAPWRGTGRILVALRLQTWGVQLRRLP